MSKVASSSGKPCVEVSHLLDYLDCPICENLLTGPTTMCTSGHTFCQSCVTDKCIVCNSDFTERMRNLPIEEICRYVGHPCPFKSSGCNFSMSERVIADHAARCSYRKMACPLTKIPNMHCDWNGCASDLSQHVFEAHEATAYEGPKLVTDTLSEETLFLVFEDEVFVLYKFIENSSLHAVVQKAGVQFDDFKCSFLLESEESPLDSISMCFPIFSLEKMSPQKVFNKGMGLILAEHVVGNYIGQNKFTVVVELDRVK